MYFQHSPGIRARHPELAAGAIVADGITKHAAVAESVAAHTAVAADRLSSGTEAVLPEIQAWRRTFSRMGLKPTRYRCAAESLLRRFRREGELPAIHPLVDLCNAVSMAFAIPVAVLDRAAIRGGLEVRHATGGERSLTLSGQPEHPAEGEVTFADAEGNAHARRWTNRQSGLSVVRDSTASVLIVAEAVHAGAAEDVARLVPTLAGELTAIWGVATKTALLTADEPRFEF
ncbi:hypothetical protein DI005_24945 [Prauserella sp. PE36]|uniref:B3/B4 domain-containing protein n=1 Tax=Prauserella sp. PE36 TaxID=1504709 RepID=UPI000DE3DB84|nr:phenylalanine--tRNA ligase beta subunit-related protein [Prauserella sp. PE36]RBM16543.1 hypothetical protein DI005_24945 [Prauserella sp. PE36]